MEMESWIALAGVVVSAIAAVVTAWMAVETRRMAVVSSETLRLERAAILGFRNLQVELSAKQAQVDSKETGTPATNADAISIRVGLELFNAGRVPIKYVMKSLKLTLAGRAMDTPQFMSRTGRVLPGSSAWFFHPSMALDPPVTMYPAKGTLRFEFEYSAEGDKETNTLSGAVEYTITGTSPGSPLSWLHIDEP